MTYSPTATTSPASNFKNATLKKRGFTLNPKNRNISLKMAAELSGTAVSTVSDWTSGTMPNDIEAVGEFCRKLGIDFEWMMLGTTKNKSINSIPIDQLFDEQDVGLEGIFKVSAVKLVHKKE